VKTIVEGSGGTVAAATGPAGGVAISIELPIA
jgi:hypothetical protein